MKKRYAALAGLLLTGVFALTACSQAEQPTATVVIFNPTPAGSQPTATSSSGATAPVATQAPATGDAARGEEAFASNGCSACHSTGANQIVGPGLAGVYERAGSRVAGLSADAYIAQSVREPTAYIVETFLPVMTAFPQLTDGEIADLIAYMKTLQ